MMKTILRSLMILFSLIIGLYPAIYFFIDRRFGLLSSKPNALLVNPFWNVGFYTHIILGGIALLIGWVQFSPKFRNANITLHRQVGKLYIISASISAAAGIGIAFFATGGFLSAAGFITLGIIWFYTTIVAYFSIRSKKLDQHQKMMVYSYAACFAAVTLRIWLPLLVMGLGNFIEAYTVVAWLCWLPNMFVAYLITKKMEAV